MSFRNLKLGIEGELEVASEFPPKMSKWKRFVTMSQSDIEEIASKLDAWIREIFDNRSDWSPAVANAVQAVRGIGRE